MRIKACYLAVMLVAAGAVSPLWAPSGAAETEGREGAPAPKLLWSTTFDCPAWEQSDGLSRKAVNCDGLSGFGGWYIKGYEDQITAEANHPVGGGGKGFRHWEGDGSNKGGGGIFFQFEAPQPEFWVRWYMRYEKGFKWKGGGPHYDKLLYIRSPKHGSAIVALMYANGIGIGNYHGPGKTFASRRGGWRDIMGGEASDGRWHCYEAHLKLDTDGTDGVIEIWVDGKKTFRHDGQNYKGHVGCKGWNSILIGSNQSAPANGRPMYQDWDDIAISLKGHIGPLPKKDAPPAGRSRTHRTGQERGR